MRRLTLALAATAAILSTPAFAGQICERCFAREVTPPMYATVHQPVVVRPARTVAHVVPAQYGVVHETVRVRPARTVAHVVPAQVRRVHQTVQVSPGGRSVERSVDAHGRMVICEVTRRPIYQTVAHDVVVAPARVVHHHVPAEYATVARRVRTAPAHVVHRTIPAEVHHIPTQVQVSPAREHWVPVRGSRQYNAPVW